VSVARDSTYNLLGAVLPVAVSLLTVPIYLSVIGEERFGVLALAWLFLGYFGVFDLGLGKATAQRIASLGHTSADRSRIFWGAMGVNTAAGVLGGLVLYVAARVAFEDYFKVSSALREEMLAAVWLLALAVPIATVSGVIGGALMGRQRFREINLISGGASVVSQLATLATAMLISTDLTWLVLTVVVTRVLTLILLFYECRRHAIGGEPLITTKAEVVALLGFGGWVTISGLVSPLMVVLDRFVIGGMLGAVAVAIYTVPWQLAQRALILPGAIQSALFPRQASADETEQIRLTQTGIAAIAAILTPVIGLGIFAMEPFLKVWIGGNFHVQAAPVGQIALLGFWANGMAYVPFAQIEARGKARIGALVHLAELPAYLAALYLLMMHYGLPGAAVAFSLRCILDGIVLNWICLRRDAPWGLPLRSFAIALASLMLANWLEPFHWDWWVALAGFTLAAAWNSYGAAPPVLRQAGRAFFSRALRRTAA
jgi:O-antigen/teichoic acid export membrane protein